MSASERCEWTELEAATAVYFASRDCDVFAIARLLQHRGHNRSAYATRYKLQRIRRLNPNLKGNGRNTWDKEAVDSWLLSLLSLSEVEHLTALREEEESLINEVSHLSTYGFWH
jgi:hypothetical protein